VNALEEVEMSKPAITGQDAKSSQTMESVFSGGHVRQASDAPANQTMKDVAAIGDVEQIINEGGLDTIAAELQKLQTELAKYDPNATTEIARLKAAESAARQGDKVGVAENLKGAARWVLDFATKVGTTVIAKIIETQLGLGSKP
jgi:hypothetical protein